MSIPELGHERGGTMAVWRKLFVILLSLNLMVFVLVALWFGTLPKATSKVHVSSIPTTDANVELTIGQQAVNSYLTYALEEQKDVKNVLRYVTVGFSDNWNIQLGVNVAGRVIPCDVVLTPTVHNGNLWLPVASASIGGINVPKSLLFYLFSHAPWPTWIVVDSHSQQIDVNLTERPQSKTSPYHIRAIGYSTVTRALTFLVSISPKQLKTTSVH